MKIINLLKKYKNSILAVFGDDKASIRLAILHMNDGDFSTSLRYLSRINLNELKLKNVKLYNNYLLCQKSIIYMKQTYNSKIDFLQPDYIQQQQFKYDWYLIKKAIKDGLIKDHIVDALEKVPLKQDDVNDYITFLFNHINKVFYSI